MTSDQLSAVAGVVLSLAFSYVPGLSDWWGAKEPTVKRLIMAMLLLLVAAGAFGLSCANVVSNIACSRDGVLGIVNAFVAALVANQAAYLISPNRRPAAPK